MTDPLQVAPDLGPSSSPVEAESRHAGAGGNLWLRFAVRRLAGLVGVLVVLLLAVFLMVRAVPGDPVLSALGSDTDPTRVAEIRAAEGFDLPVYEQFGRYVKNLASGDLGSSFRSSLPVTDLIKERIGSSLELAAAALLLTLIVSVPFGIFAAAMTQNGRNPRFEALFTAVTSAVGSLPEYLLGTVLVFVFAIQLDLLPPAGGGGLDSLILPALAVSIPSMMTLARIVRVETLNVLGQDYVRTARSQRLPVDLIYLRHVLPNVMTAALTVSGLIFASIIGGAVIVETVFARPGLGTALVTAVLSHEYVVVQGIALVLGVAVVVVNALVDIAIAILDPRSITKEG